jgi:non-specific serine/threonine protein kinase
VVSKDELYQAVWSDTHVEPGSLKTCISKIRRVLDDDAVAPRYIAAVTGRGYRFVGQVGVSNLPVSLTSFVGRTHEREGVERLLHERRLVTIWGPAGIGKTRLAIEVARDLMLEMPQGVWWIDLSSVSVQDEIAQRVSQALGLRGVTGVDTLIAALHDRRLLLILDNFEHLVNEGASLVLSLLRSCPHLKILVTSRESLGVAGESVWPLVPLSVPDSVTGDDDLFAFDAIRLFAERARDANPLFAITPDNAQAVARICQCIDGLPLAIELAAARVRSVAAEQMAARLDDLMKLLAQRSQTDPARHQTLKSAFDWSYDPLSARERDMFASLWVFAGSFSLAAVESVCSDVVGCPTSEVLDVLSHLVDRSLVTTEPSPDGTRYRLLNTVRQYAGKKLAADLEATLLRRHAEFFLRLAEQMAPSFYGPNCGAALLLMSREQDNFHAVMKWSRDCEDGAAIGLRLAAALWPWTRRGRMREGRTWIEAALERAASASPRVVAEALCGAGVVATLFGDLAQARKRLEESVALWRTTDELVGLGRALDYLGQLFRQSGDMTSAHATARESVEVLRRAGSPWDLALSLSGFGTVKRLLGRADEAAALYHESAGILRALGDAWTLRYPVGELASLAARQHQYDLAEAYARQCLIGLQPVEETYFLSVAIAALAQVRFARSDYQQAARLFGAAEGLRAAARLSAERGDHDFESEASVSELRAALGNVQFGELWKEGRTLSPKETIALALVLTAPVREASTWEDRTEIVRP